MSDFVKLEKIIGIKFRDIDLLRESLTHRSYLNENPSWKKHNERLEFLGDAVLELITTEFLFEKYPEKLEGELTALRASLINYQILAEVAEKIDLGKYLFLSKGEAKDSDRARRVISANAFEALTAAIYLDQGYQSVKKFIHKFLLPRLDEIIQKQLYRDSKSLLQEIIQEKKKLTPVYKILESRGPEHKKVFRVGVYFDEELVAEGSGFSKQEAEVNAASRALDLI